MRLRQIDKENIYISNLKGYDLNDKPIYNSVKLIQGQVQDVSGRIHYNEKGVSEDYTYKVLIEYSDDTKNINEFTRFWVKTVPSTRTDDYNYVVSKKTSFINGIMTLYLKPSEQNWETIYTYDNEIGIFSIQCLFDKDNLILKVPKNIDFEVAFDTNLWLKEPENVNSTKFKLELEEVLKDTNEYYQYKMRLAND